MRLRYRVCTAVTDAQNFAQSHEPANARIAVLERALAAKHVELAAKHDELAAVLAERDRLRHAYERLQEQLALLQRRLYVAKAERVNAQQLELEFAHTKAQLDALGVVLGELPAPGDPVPDGGHEEPRKKPRSAPKGRRDLRDVDMPEERIELLDAALEASAERIGFEESCRLGYRRGGPVRIVVARATYKLSPDADAGIHADTRVRMVTVERPKELLRRSLLAPSMLAHLLYSKYGMGLPFYRCEEQLAREGIDLDRGAMCRYAEDTGASLGGVVEAMARDAMATAFCLATDATGVAIQPTPLADKSRQPCRKGHFFVVLADNDHVFFEYQPKHTSAAVCEMFRGFSGYLQADAHAIYDALYRGEAVASGIDSPKEVACWAHVRRKFWEAATAKHALGREGLYRIRALFERDALLNDLPPAKRKELRHTTLRPLVDDFFAWVRARYDGVNHERGMVATALGYAVRQETALRRFLEDGRLRMDNNASERALRSIAVGRKNWLFFGSDDHAQAAANLFSLIASCKLHRLDPETYLAELIRVLPSWPRDRYLELSPRDWLQTRARLDPAELARPLGPLAIPPPKQQPLPN